MKRHHYAAALFLSVLLCACGGGDYVPQANHAPVASAGPAQIVSVGTSVKLNGSATDADQDLVSYTWTLSRPANSAAYLLNSKVATPTFNPDVAGVYVATLIVNDGKLDSLPSTVMITAQ
ncbi:PKD domain-containing protein [Duganella fentianensis]|uniref:PKD domain-containing protein n=1 Tax=Duganella fentianensis TaxID=2692177 RepID=UPI0032B2ACF7